MFEFWREHAAHRRFHFVNQMVNDGVVTQIQAFRFDNATSRSIGTHVEANQNSVRSRSKRGVSFSDTAHAGTDDFNLHFIGRQLQQGIADRFHRTLNVGFEHDVHF